MRYGEGFAAADCVSCVRPLAVTFNIAFECHPAIHSEPSTASRILIVCRFASRASRRRTTSTFRQFVVGPSFKQTPRRFFIYSPPLLKKERHTSGATLTTNLQHPCSIHVTRMRPRFTANNYPLNILQRQIRQRAKQWFKRQEMHYRRDDGQVGDAFQHVLILNAGSQPYVWVTITPVILPEGFDERATFEISLKGWLSAQVELEDGDRYAVYFSDPIRLQQDLDENVKLGKPCVAEPGLIILPEVTVEAIQDAVQFLWEQGFFTNLKANSGNESEVTTTAPDSRLQPRQSDGSLVH